jgi:hypothetical protein
MRTLSAEERRSQCGKKLMEMQGRYFGFCDRCPEVVLAHYCREEAEAYGWVKGSDREMVWRKSMYIVFSLAVT